VVHTEFSKAEFAGRLAVTMSHLAYPMKIFLGSGYREATGHAPYKNTLKNEKCPKFSAEHAGGGP